MCNLSQTKEIPKASAWSDEECTEQTQEEDEEISENFVTFTVALTEPQSELENDSDHDKVDKLTYEDLEKILCRIIQEIRNSTEIT